MSSHNTTASPSSSSVPATNTTSLSSPNLWFCLVHILLGFTGLHFASQGQPYVASFAWCLAMMITMTATTTTTYWLNSPSESYSLLLLLPPWQQQEPPSSMSSFVTTLFHVVAATMVNTTIWVAAATAAVVVVVDTGGGGDGDVVSGIPAALACTIVSIEWFTVVSSLFWAADLFFDSETQQEQQQQSLQQQSMGKDNNRNVSWLLRIPNNTVTGISSSSIFYYYACAVGWHAAPLVAYLSCQLSTLIPPRYKSALCMVIYTARAMALVVELFYCHRYLSRVVLGDVKALDGRRKKCQ